MNESAAKRNGLYLWSRKIHLYLGIAISPFLLVFAISTLMLNHGVTPNPIEESSVASLEIEDGVEGPALVSTVLDQLGLTGEVVGRGQILDGKTVVRVSRPGKVTVVTVDIAAREAQVKDRIFGLMDTMRYLHLNPGPHKSPTWTFSKLWGWVADSTVYITLLLTLTGVYMWVVLKSERRAGLIALGSGAFGFAIILFTLLAL